MIGEFNLDPECPDHSSIPLPNERTTVSVQLEQTPKKVAQELEMENWRVELPFDFLSKFVCSNCGSVESVRKPVKEVKLGQTKCPQCGNLKREAVQYFRVTDESEDAELSFRDFGLGDRELIQLVSEDKRLCLETIDD